MLSQLNNTINKDIKNNQNIIKLDKNSVFTNNAKQKLAMLEDLKNTTDNYLLFFKYFNNERKKIADVEDKIEQLQKELETYESNEGAEQIEDINLQLFEILMYRLEKQYNNFNDLYEKNKELINDYSKIDNQIISDEDKKTKINKVENTQYEISSIAKKCSEEVDNINELFTKYKKRTNDSKNEKINEIKQQIKKYNNILDTLKNNIERLYNNREYQDGDDLVKLENININELTNYVSQVDINDLKYDDIIKTYPMLKETIRNKIHLYIKGNDELLAYVRSFDAYDNARELKLNKINNSDPIYLQYVKALKNNEKIKGIIHNNIENSKKKNLRDFQSINKTNKVRSSMIKNQYRVNFDKEKTYFSLPINNMTYVNYERILNYDKQQAKTVIFNGDKLVVNKNNIFTAQVKKDEASNTYKLTFYDKVRKGDIIEVKPVLEIELNKMQLKEFRDRGIEKDFRKMNMYEISSSQQRSVS